MPCTAQNSAAVVAYIGFDASKLTSLFAPEGVDKEEQRRVSFSTLAIPARIIDLGGAVS
jgi:hypothetical protein